MDSSPTHTPGPWRFMNAGEFDDCGLRILASKDGQVAHVYQRPRVAANAQLIAAAPDLLVALERAVEACERHNDEESLDYDWTGEAEAAIAKAKGGGE